jgi:hypothetical protein
MNYQPCNPGIDPVLLFEEVDGDRKRGRGGGSSESRRESVGHVGDEPEKTKTFFEWELISMMKYSS